MTSHPGGVAWTLSAEKTIQLSRCGLVVQHLLHKKCHCATVDRIPLGDDYMKATLRGVTRIVICKYVPVD